LLLICLSPLLFYATLGVMLLWSRSLSRCFLNHFPAHLHSYVSARGMTLSPLSGIYHRFSYATLEFAFGIVAVGIALLFPVSSPFNRYLVAFRLPSQSHYRQRGFELQAINSLHLSHSDGAYLVSMACKLCCLARSWIDFNVAVAISFPATNPSLLSFCSQ
jgi:hypothetical protein